MRELHFCAWLAIVAGLGGCATDLDVRKLEADQPRIGAGYTLPFTQYAATVTWRVAECIPGQAAASATKGKPASPEVKGQIKIVTKVEIADGQADDARQAFIFNPTQLESLLSISALKLTWQDGKNQLSTVNLSSEDRTGQVIGKFATGVGKLALAAAGAGAAGIPADACTPETYEAWKAAKDQKIDLEIKTSKVKAAQAKLKAATDKVAAMGVNASEGAKTELGDAIDGLNAAIKAQASASDDLEESVKLITRQQVVHWPRTSDLFATEAGDEIRLPEGALDRWASLKEADRTAVLQQTKVYFSIERIGSFGVQPKDTVGTPPKVVVREPKTLTVGVKDRRKSGAPNEHGLRYRMPALGRVYACNALPCDASSPEIYASLEGPVAQLGYVNVLPVRTRRFGSTVFSAEFTPLGALKSAGYEQKVAAAENVADAFGQTVDAATPLIRYNQGETARDRAEQLAYLKYLKDQRDALAALEADPNAQTSLGARALDADTALINARIANLGAQMTLAETEAKMAKSGVP